MTLETETLLVEMRRRALRGIGFKLSAEQVLDLLRQIHPEPERGEVLQVGTVEPREDGSVTLSGWAMAPPANSSGLVYGFTLQELAAISSLGS